MTECNYKIYLLNYSQSERVTQPGTPNNGTFLTRTFTTNGVITGVRTIDIINSVSLASTELVSGGLGREEVTLLFSTPLAGHALDYRVEIFTSASSKIKASFLIIMITSLITFLQLK